MQSLKAYKYRIYPAKKQKKLIDETIENCRTLYNELLGMKIDQYKKDAINLSRKDLYKIVKGNKTMHSQVSQNVADRIDKAFKNFFRRLKNGTRKQGFPRFKKRGTYTSITLPQVVNPTKIGNKTHFPKVGWLNVRYHRSITGKPKTITIKKARTGKYFLTVCCENAIGKNIKTTRIAVGIDMGLNHFVATSNGEFFEHPKPLRRLAKKRSGLARRLSKKIKGSANWEKARIKLARTEDKMTSIRNDFSWKLSNHLIKQYGNIFAEKLDIQRMVKNRYLSAAILDVSWADFLQKLSYKAESAGGKVMKIDPKGTSQKCSGCGRVVKKLLSTRLHKCPHCGLKLDRDINAARNILIRGIGQELPESTPVRDGTSTLAVLQEQVSLLNQEALFNNKEQFTYKGIA